MNRRMICRVLGLVLLIEAVMMLVPALVALLYGENLTPWGISIAATAGVGGLMLAAVPQKSVLYAREGFVSVALSWLLMSAFGALPLRLSGEVTHYADAMFEIVSGFTTTGASILLDVEGMSRGLLFWRSMTHWIGGLGVLVFILAVLPLANNNAMHIMRAEVPGPTVGKIVPRARDTARILYLIYFALTVIETIFLLAGGMPLYDALIHAFGTAGTGGFSNRALSLGAYNSPYIEWVIGIFLVLFSINFNLYYFILCGGVRDALRDQELHLFGALVLLTTGIITIDILPLFDGFSSAVRHAFFQVMSITSTAGFATADFNLWPEVSRWVLVLLMFCGACAGSTGGGIKIGRILLMGRAARCEIRRMSRPRTVNRVMVNGKAVDDETLRGSLIFFFLYILMLIVGTLLVSFDGFDTTTNFTAVLSCLSNVGPGLGLVGPMGNFAMYSVFSKIVLTAAMLIGRLEIFPILILFSPSLWKR